MGGGEEKKRKEKLNNDKHHAEKAVTDRKNASPYSRKNGALEVPTLLEGCRFVPSTSRRCCWRFKTRGKGPSNVTPSPLGRRRRVCRLLY